MNFFLPRMLFAAVMAVLGAMAGSAIGWGGDAVLVLTVIGAAMGASASAFVDRVRGYRLMQWMRQSQDRPPPRVGAFWGELAYRIERSMTLLRREAEAERSQTREFLSAIEASPNGVLLLDRHDQIEWCNSEAADHFGLDPQRDLQQRITNLVRDPAFVVYLQQGVFDAGVSFAGRRGRGTLNVLVRRYGADKKLVLSQDITERERTDAMRRDFVANVSHEIRTPLTVLAGFVETLASLPLSEGERHRVLALMQQQTDRMQALVADLLTLAQLEGSPLPSPEAWVPVDALLAQVQADARVLSSGQHRIDFSATAGLELAGNRIELHSAMANLVTNAVRYTPAGGQIQVHWQWRADGGATLSVTDDGPGIAREHIPRLTERFYRVDGSRSRESGGTGLGLSIVKHVMQRHGGEVDIDSEPGRGSTFRLTFPAARVRRISASPAESSGLGHAVVDGQQLARLSGPTLSGHETPAGPRP